MGKKEKIQKNESFGNPGKQNFIMNWVTVVESNRILNILPQVVNRYLKELSKEEKN